MDVSKKNDASANIDYQANEAGVERDRKSGCHRGRQVTRVNIIPNDESVCYEIIVPPGIRKTSFRFVSFYPAGDQSASFRPPDRGGTRSEAIGFTNTEGVDEASENSSDNGGEWDPYKDGKGFADADYDRASFFSADQYYCGTDNPEFPGGSVKPLKSEATGGEIDSRTPMKRLLPLAIGLDSQIDFHSNEDDIYSVNSVLSSAAKGVGTISETANSPNASLITSALSEIPIDSLTSDSNDSLSCSGSLQSKTSSGTGLIGNSASGGTQSLRSLGSSSTVSSLIVDTAPSAYAQKLKNITEYIENPERTRTASSIIIEGLIGYDSNKPPGWYRKAYLATLAIESVENGIWNECANILGFRGEGKNKKNRLIFLKSTFGKRRFQPGFIHFLESDAVAFFQLSEFKQLFLQLNSNIKKQFINNSFAFAQDRQLLYETLSHKTMPPEMKGVFFGESGSKADCDRRSTFESRFSNDCSLALLFVIRKFCMFIKTTLVSSSFKKANAKFQKELEGIKAKAAEHNIKVKNEAGNDVSRLKSYVDYNMAAMLIEQLSSSVLSRKDKLTGVTGYSFMDESYRTAVNCLMSIMNALQEEANSLVKDMEGSSRRMSERDEYTFIREVLKLESSAVGSGYVIKHLQSAMEKLGELKKMLSDRSEGDQLSV